MPLIQGETLRGWRRSRGWDVPEMARRIRQASGGDPTLPAHDSLLRMIRRWEKEGLNTASRAARYEFLYAKALGVPPGDLVVGPAEPGVSSVLPAGGNEDGDVSESGSEHPVVIADEDDVKRRQLFKAIGGVALTAQITGGEDRPGEYQSASDRSPEALQSVTPAIYDLCSVLTDYGFGVDKYATARGSVRSLTDLERDLEVSYDAYQQSRFTAAVIRVSALLADAQLALQARNVERTGILRVLALSYQLAASLLGKAGHNDMSWIAAERGLNTAKECEIPIIQGSLIRSVAFALLSAGRFESAIRLVESGADSLGTTITEDAASLSVYGTLFLAGSVAAARFGDEGKVTDYLHEADRAATRLGRDANYLWTAFGPTNVAIHRVNTAVELGDIQTVLDYGLSLNTNAVPAERRVRYLLDVARTHSLTNSNDDALGSLLDAERIAPEQTHQHYLTKRVIITLAKNTKGKPPVQLEKLATRVGLRVNNLWQIRQINSQHHAWLPARSSCAKTRSSSSIRRMRTVGIFQVAMWTLGNHQPPPANERFGKN